MATSNSTDWSLNRDQLITVALRKLMVLPSGQAASLQQIADATDSLQAILKIFQADGMPLWKISGTTFSTVAGISTYTVGIGQTINIPKPLRIIKALVTTTNSDATPLNLTAKYDFLDLPSTATGTPSSLLYVPGRITGTVSLWPIPDASTYTISIYYQLPFEDVDNSTDDFDFPSEWALPIIYTLAWVMAPEYDIPILDRQQLQKEADYWHQYVLSMGSEEGSMTLVPDDRGF